MFGANEVETRLTYLQRYLPNEVTVPDRDAPVTADALIRVIRAELVPFVTYGPSYVHTVADSLGMTLSAFRRGSGKEFTFWLGRALRAGVTARARQGEPFDAQTRTVTATAWNVSYETGSGIDGVRLHVHDFNDSAPATQGCVDHPMYDGLRFASVADANEFTYRAGLVKRYVPRTAQA